MSNAATDFFASQEEGGVEAQGGAEEVPQIPEGYTGPRTLDGRPAPTSAIPTVGSSSRSRPTRQAPRSGFATLDSLNQGAAGSHAGHGHDDDDDSDDEDYMDDEQPRDLFAGGEKSGLAVQDPRRNDPRSLVKDIIKKAQA
jgi:UBX domain-containing protein 1